MTQQQLEALLGRPLTPTEVENLDLYLEIAQESLAELLCMSLEVNPDGSGDPETDTRVFDVREGYSTVFTGIFTEIKEVKVDGEVTTDYYPVFWDKRSNTFYNSIVLNHSGKTVEITGFWGFDSLPRDLQMLLAQLFANASKKYQSGGANIKSKQTEDFRINYGDLTDDEAFINANQRTINKYSLCNVGYVLHGSTCGTHGRYDCGYCI